MPAPLGTVIVIAILAAVVFLAVRYLVRKSRRNENDCDGNCGNCPGCH